MTWFSAVQRPPTIANTTRRARLRGPPIRGTLLTSARCFENHVVPVRHHVEYHRNAWHIPRWCRQPFGTSQSRATRPPQPPNGDCLWQGLEDPSLASCNSSQHDDKPLGRHEQRSRVRICPKLLPLHTQHDGGQTRLSAFFSPEYTESKRSHVNHIGQTNQPNQERRPPRPEKHLLAKRVTNLRFFLGRGERD